MMHTYQLRLLAWALLLWRGVFAPIYDEHNGNSDYDDYWPFDLTAEERALDEFRDNLQDTEFLSSLDCNSIKFMMWKIIPYRIDTEEVCSETCIDSMAGLNDRTGLLFAIPARIDYIECRRVNLICTNAKAFFFNASASNPHGQQLPRPALNRYRGQLRRYCAHLTYVIKTMFYLRQGKGEATWISSTSFCERMLDHPLVSDSASERPEEPQQARNSHERAQGRAESCICAVKIFYPAVFSPLQLSTLGTMALSPTVRDIIASGCNLPTFLGRFQIHGWLLRRWYPLPRNGLFPCSDARLRRCPSAEEMNITLADL